MHCLRAKSKQEILAINQVGRIVCLGGPDEQGVGFTINHLLLKCATSSPWFGVLSVQCERRTRQANYDFKFLLEYA